MAKNLLTLIILLLGIASSASTQDYLSDSDDFGLKYRKYRVTLVPGISSNGVDAPKYTAKYSFNLIAGYHGGLDGFEIGPININKYYSRGMQIGALNYSGGDMQGFHLGGIANIANGDMQGMQFSGIANVANGTVQGLQLSGIVNVSNNDMQGLQLSGIANVSNGNIQGLQLAGIANISNGSSQGLIGAGIANISDGEAQGLYYAGIINYSEDFQGIAASGILNYSENTQGIQLSGIGNIAEDFQGIQVSGLFNYAEYGQGIQVGLFNFGETFEGVPVGLVSWYENGRHQLDVWANDGGMLYAGLKTGTHEVYNMLSVGYNPSITDRDVWALAWSIGLHRPLEEAWDNPRFAGYFLNQDFTVQHIQEGEYDEDSLNHVYSYRYLLGKELRRGINFYAGPTLNMMVSRDARNDDYTWYTIHDINRKGRDYKFWIGLSAGFQLN